MIRFVRFAAILMVLLLGAVSHSFAQLPTIMLPKAVSPVPTETVAPMAHQAALAKELQGAQARLADANEVMGRLQQQLEAANHGPDTTRNDLLKQFNQRQMLVDRYSQQVDDLKQLQVLDQKIANARQQLENWQAPTGSPPWSILEGDQVQNELSLKSTRLKQLTKQAAVIADQIVTFSREKSEAEVRLRQAQDSLAAGDATKQSPLGRSAVDEAKLALSGKEAILLRSDLARRLNENERVLLQLQIDAAEKTLRYFDGRFELSSEMLASVNIDLQSLIDRDRALEFKALAQAEAALKRLTQAQELFQKLEKNSVSAAALAEGRARLEIAQAQEVAARSDVERLRQLIEIGGYAQSVWAVRAELYGNKRPDAVRLDEIASRFKLGLIRTAQAREDLQQTVTTREQEAFDLREAAIIAKTPLEKQVVAAKLSATNAQADGARQVLAAIDKFEQFLMLVKEELGIKDSARTLSERIVAFGQRAAALGRTIWHYELLTVDDSVIADGKEVKAVRSITVSKSVGALGLLVFGYLLVSWLIRATVGLAERRMGIKTSVGTQIRRWLTLLATGTLIILSFNLVQIPLSVFAFLGGALAIGAGFGTQNLLKNLISGVMLLIERPIRLGDLVEVDGVKGRVTSIGIRFSTIHSPDGVDTLIPNSELVEKKLVNWTYSNPDARREIKVGVAYGADPVQVSNLLQAAALEHPQVMHVPAPVVTLDDFADSALLFSLRYWLRLDPGLDGRQIDSDLRCEILDKLRRAGIDIPFPQRDVHLVRTSPTENPLNS